MTVFFPYLPEYISQINSAGFAPLGYQITANAGDLRRCIESYPVASATSQNLMVLPNGAKYDVNQTYDAPTVLAPFDISWTLHAPASVPVATARVYFEGDVADLSYIPYSRVRIYASDGSRMWYLNTRGIRIQTTLQGSTPRIMRVTATFDPLVNYWQEGGPATAS